MASVKPLPGAVAPAVRQGGPDRRGDRAGSTRVGVADGVLFTSDEEKL